VHAQTAAASLTLLVGREAVPHRPSPRPRFSRPGQQLPGPHYWPGHGADPRHGGLEEGAMSGWGARRGESGAPGPPGATPQDCSFATLGVLQSASLSLNWLLRLTMRLNRP